MPDSSPVTKGVSSAAVAIGAPTTNPEKRYLPYGNFIPGAADQKRVGEVLEDKVLKMEARKVLALIVPLMTPITCPPGPRDSRLS